VLTVNADICAVKATVTAAASPSSTHTSQLSLLASQDDRRPSSTTALPSPLTEEAVIRSYGDLFTGVGLLEGDVHLEVDPSVPPVQMPPGRLPVTIRDQVKNELDRLCRENIIEPVTEPSPWISALMVAVKPNYQAKTVRRHQAVEQGAEETTLSDYDVLPPLALRFMAVGQRFRHC